ncbi:MAG: hypothetical protein ACLPT4_13675 [Verrucomicrobiia bacterium]
MIEATLRGKVPTDARSDEDCLTSTVWGLLKYRPIRPILARFVSKAALYSDQAVRLGEKIPEKLLDVDRLQVVFWPSDPEFGQPDILILGLDLALVVEVKYHAELSGVDQLRKYHSFLNSRYSDKTHRHVVYLTANWVAPELTNEATTGLETSLWWLSWYELVDAARELSCISPAADEIRNDLVRYLQHLGFEFFQGIQLPNVEELETVFWQDMVPIISGYEEPPRVNHYFWQENKI